MGGKVATRQFCLLQEEGEIGGDHSNQVVQNHQTRWGVNRRIKLFNGV
jgi:hypothetical protein